MLPDDVLLRIMEEKVRSWKNRQSAMNWMRLSRAEKLKKIKELLYFKKCKNWCHLPPEIKLEVIKVLDFPGRLKLRMTARNERDLVDSLKINFESVTLTNDRSQRWGVIQMTPSPRGILLESFVSFRIFNNKLYTSAVHFLAYALKIGKIDSLEILEGYSPKRFNDFLKVLEKSAPFNVKNLKIKNLKKDAVMLFMKNLTPGVETIRLDGEGCESFPFDEFLTFPVFYNCETIKIESLAIFDAPSKLAKKWIDNDAEIGTKLQCGLSARSDVYLLYFVEEFSDRIVYQNENEARIWTNNDSKHILLRFFIQYEGLSGDEYLTCSIIPSDLEKSEYDLNTDWTVGMEAYDHFGMYGTSWSEPEPDPLELFPVSEDTLDDIEERFRDMGLSSGKDTSEDEDND
ncbi:hypothetical protein GCK72_004076 [Caenorhabditis remanei]|uniref:F-box domain-containing protein n=1 Tax=Caenorhabditis remanei TaxID=31234 RepID=A0A6A5HAN7_CAERE|nr:hypothetical protein GCK72_004076 [Caenorhabditis remanei]KAF1764129.1 hypothetical protein GCK72_004076 [Caenorhabditis remanei]